jgi:hypothetical protein
MDANTRPSYEAELPTPQPPAPEQGGLNLGALPNAAPGEVPAQTENHNIELPAAPAPTIPVPGAPQPPPLAGAMPQSPTTQPGGVASTQVLDDTLAAEDSDLIEKEWVIKAKAIVEQTRYDPYRQNKEINRVKADYIKKRYNKDIKISEE